MMVLLVRAGFAPLLDGVTISKTDIGGYEAVWGSVFIAAKQSLETAI